MFPNTSRVLPVLYLILFCHVVELVVKVSELEKSCHRGLGVLVLVECQVGHPACKLATPVISKGFYFETSVTTG